MPWFRSQERDPTLAVPANPSLQTLSPVEQAGRIGLAQYATDMATGFEVDKPNRTAKLHRVRDGDARVVTLMPLDVLQSVITLIKDDLTAEVTHGKEATLSELESELAERRTCIEDFGFDAILHRALLDTYGLKAIPCPLALHPGEEAYLCDSAVLQRFQAQRSFVGGSHGLSIPLGFGFRYRVGSYRGSMVSSGEKLTAVDTGTLVLTSQRIAFLGAKTTITVPLGKVVNLDVYSDGFTLHREDRRSTETFSVASPQLYWLYFDHLMSLPTARKV